MTDFTRDEMEAAFRHYFMVGPVYEDWVEWAQLFTDDAVYTEHFWGTFVGPEAIQRFIEGTMATAPQVYSVLLWYVIDPVAGKVVYKVLNRADNPEPGAAPIDFPSFQIVTYAGGGKWSAEEDVWTMYESKEWGERYAEACRRHDPDHAAKMTRLDWGSDVDWARPEPGTHPKPSWYGRDDVVLLRSRRDVSFGRT